MNKNTMYKCLRCNYLCNNLKRINEHLERKNMCKDINNCNIDDINILKAKILENLIKVEKKTKTTDDNLISKIKQEEYNLINESLIVENNNNLSENNTQNDNITLSHLPDSFNINKHEINNNSFLKKDCENTKDINKDYIKNNHQNTSIFTIKEMLKNDEKIDSCLDFSKLFDTQKQVLNISKHLKIDIIFNYNITLNIKEVSPFMKNPRMKESIEKLIAVVKNENNKIANEQIKKNYDEIRDSITDLNSIDEKKIELMFEKTINMKIDYYLIYYYCDIDQKGFFYIYDINYQKI